MDKSTILNKLRALGFDKAVSTIHDLDAIRKRREDRHESRPDFRNAEPLSEKEFVRLFGTKVKHVRYSGRPDFVGLMVRGDRLGFMVVRSANGRRIRFIVKEDGDWKVAKSYIPVHHKDSICAMQKGLLRNVS